MSIAHRGTGGGRVCPAGRRGPDGETGRRRPPPVLDGRRTSVDTPRAASHRRNSGSVSDSR